MEHAAVRFARRVLIAHLLLLAAVVIVVLLATREIYRNARQQSLDQASKRQELLAAQTSRGMEAFYQSILSDLDLLRESEELNDPATAGRPPAPGLRAVIMAPALWNQLKGRVSYLFAVDRHSAIRVIRSFNDAELAPVQQIAEFAEAWLRTVEGPSVSEFMTINGQGVNLAAVPVAGETGRLLVAVVPIRNIEQNFLDEVNKEASMSATLLDNKGSTMATSDEDLVGLRMSEHLEDPVLQKLAIDVIREARRHTVVLERPVRIGSVELSPRIVTAEPVQIPGRTWTVLIATQLQEVDSVITQIRGALIWTVLVVVVMTGILVSTAIQLIRNRVRLERVRTDLLTRELNQAREIQLQWLPEPNCRVRSIDIAALNQPASHISGDFYNWFELPDGRTVVTIGDVTGHGMAAAFLMATTQLLVRTTMIRLRDPGQCLEEVNRQLCSQVFSGQFVTMLIMVLNPDDGTVEVATAGHPAPLYGDGEHFAPLAVEPQLVLGIERHVTFPTERFPLSPRGSFLLYTDGVTDAQALSGERFSTEGLCAALYGRFDNAQLIIDVAVDAVNDFRQGRELSDDLTMVAVQLQSVDTCPPDEQDPALATPATT